MELDAAIGPVDLHGLTFGIDQPAELRAVRQMLPQLLLQALETVGVGTQLDDEVRAEVHQSLAVLGEKRLVNSQDASGARRASLGSTKPAEESKVMPWPSWSAHTV